MLWLRQRCGLSGQGGSRGISGEKCVQAAVCWKLGAAISMRLCDASILLGKLYSKVVYLVTKTRHTSAVWCKLLSWICQSDGRMLRHG